MPHDEERPRSSRSRSPPPERKTIWMGSLEPWMDEDFLRGVWRNHDDQVKVRVIGGKFSIYSLIDFSTEDSATKALALNRTIIPNSKHHRFNLAWANPPTLNGRNHYQNQRHAPEQPQPARHNYRGSSRGWHHSYGKYYREDRSDDRRDDISVNCWIQGEKSSFVVDIGSDKSVNHLKKGILADNPRSFPDIDPKDLQLCLAHISETEAAMKEFRFKDAKVLRGSDELSDVFEGKLPKKNLIHIAVKLPVKAADMGPLDKWIIDRHETVRTICELLLDKRIVQARGTPGAGKSVLGELVFRSLLKKPELRVIIIKSWPSNDLRGTERLAAEAKRAGIFKVDSSTFLATATSGNNLVFIIDDAHRAYSDDALWQAIKSQANRKESGPRFLLLSAYGSPSQYPEEIQADSTLIAIPLEQQVSLLPKQTDYSDIPLRISYTKEEAYAAMDAASQTLIKGLVLADRIKDEIMELTDGHCGGVYALIHAIGQRGDVPNLRKEGKIVTMSHVSDFFNNTSDMMAAIKKTPYNRGIPNLSDLQKDSALAKVMVEALEKGYIKWDYPLNGSDNPNPGLRKAYKRGWLQADLDEKGSKRYYFPSRLHLLNCEYLLGKLCVEEFPSQYLSLEGFCIEVIRRLSKNSLVRYSQGEGSSGVGELRTLRKPKESHYQMEFYRAMSELLDRKCFVSSEWTGRSNRKGRVDFFIPKKKWAIELLADFNRLDQHLDRFLPGPQGKYHSWIVSNEVTDYIVINLTHETKKKSVMRNSRPNFPELLHVVFTDESYQYCSLYNNLMQQLPGQNGRFALGN